MENNLHHETDENLMNIYRENRDNPLGHKAFSLFYKSQYKSQFFIAYKIVKNTEEAEDVVQESMEKFIEKIELIAARENPNYGGYLFKITVNNSLRRIKKKHFSG